MPPNNLKAPPIANGIEIGKAPKVKVILVKQTLDEFEKLLAQGWKIASTFPHASGALFLLMKD